VKIVKLTKKGQLTIFFSLKLSLFIKKLRWKFNWLNYWNSNNSKQIPFFNYVKLTLHLNGKGTCGAFALITAQWVGSFWLVKKSL